MAIVDRLNDPGTDPIFGIQTEYRQDLRDFKVDLTVGVYVPDEGGKPPIMSTLKQAERRLIEEETTKAYLSISGDREFLEATAKLIFNDADQSRMAMVQTVGGTSALHLGFEFLRKNGYKTASISDPTWDNHNQILSDLDYEIVTYPHQQAVEDFSILVKHLHELPEKTVVLLQSKSHNPTGIDFTKAQWEEISSILKARDLFPFIDSAYQGFSQSLEEDAYVIGFLLDQGHDLFVAHSFSKSFAIYNERVGAFYAVIKDPKQVGLLQRNLNRLVRVNYSNPPAHGALAIRNILNDPHLKALWEKELEGYRNRINGIREKFSAALTPIFGEKFSASIKNGYGFFCQIPFTVEQVSRLKKEFGVYLTNSGRISLPGLNSKSFDYVMDCIRKVKEG
jgi:aspartate/tyrosine/aromatic aminotransferase